MTNVFVYGTLMFDQVWERVVEGDYRKTEAKVSGFRRLRIYGEIYPGLVPGEETVDGIVYHDINTADLEKLDRFEADCYERITTEALGPDDVFIEVELYQVSPDDRGILRNEDWDPERFAAAGLSEFLARYHGFE